jgi:hypothetical protein
MSTDIYLERRGLPLENSNLSENNAGVDFRKYKTATAGGQICLATWSNRVSSTTNESV